MKKGMKKPKLVELKLSDLNPAEYNPRKISDQAMEGLSNSLETFGCVEPIIVNIRGGKNVIVGGHQRHKVLKKGGGSRKVTCVGVDLSEDDERLLNIALNNPETQGVFTKDLTEQIARLSMNASKQADLVKLRISELSAGIVGGKGDKGEAEFTSEILEENNYLVFVFDNKLDWQVARERFKLKTVQALNSRKGYRISGIGRVLSGSKLLKVLGGENPNDFYPEL